MKKRVVVEEALESVKNYLSSQGYQVSQLNNNNKDLSNCDAIVVSGQDDNFMGIMNTTTKAPVINATGKTPEEIYHQIETRIR